MLTVLFIKDVGVFFFLYRFLCMKIMSFIMKHKPLVIYKLLRLFIEMIEITKD